MERERERKIDRLLSFYGIIVAWSHKPEFHYFLPYISPVQLPPLHSRSSDKELPEEMLEKAASKVQQKSVALILNRGLDARAC